MNTLGYKNERVVQRIAKDEKITLREADDIFDETVDWLANSAAESKPTKRVDAGWHTFLLFTRDYAEFCEHYFKRFVHHEPLEVKLGIGLLSCQAGCCKPGPDTKPATALCERDPHDVRVVA